MKNKLKSLSGMAFLTLLIIGMLGGILLPDQLFSYTERRKLSQFPELSWKSILNNEYSDSLESYLLEQFPGRDIFRIIKTEFDVKVLGKTDSNGYVKVDDHLFQIAISYDENQVNQAVESFQEIINTHFVDAKVYYSVIPDKNYFVEGLPKYEYEKVNQILEEGFSSTTAIDVYDTLEIDDYYFTDLHIRQEAMFPLVNQLRMGMGMECIEEAAYEQILATSQFYGGYSANSAYLTKPDSLYYLENEMTKTAIVYDYETNMTMPIYTLDKLGEMDDYDIFLGGARALLTIQNPSVENGKKLIVFRDSFGSSIAPLLLDGYEEITLVDLRYVSANYALYLLEQKNGKEVIYDDVLFLYQVQLLYNGNSFKK